MYIAPNSDIYFLKGVPLDKTYEHTIYFTNEAQQQRYFMTKVKNRNITSRYHLTQQSYQRMNPGVIRVSLAVEELYDCNYIMYKNSANGKWFYAFVKTINYVNENVSEVEFEIDVIQTWYFDYDLQACFVEREHTTDDDFFQHTVSENLDIGDEYMCWYHQVFELNTQEHLLGRPMALAILVNRREAGGVVYPGAYINGVYSGCRLLNYKTVDGVAEPIYANDRAYIDSLLDSYQEDEIIAVYQYPSIFWTSTGIYNPIEVLVSNPGRIFGNPNDQSEQYICHNRKLCNYPYTILQVSDNSGNVTDYKFELFKQDNGQQIQGVTFYVDGVAATEPQVIIYPKNYKQIEQNYDEGMIMSNFPVCCWAGNTFKTWWAQNRNSFQMGLLTNAVAGVVGVGASAIAGRMGGAISSGASMVTNIANMVAQAQDIKNKPNMTHGSAQTSTLNASNDRYRFDFYIMKIKMEYAKIIDEYFDKFGYACKRVKVPNTYARQHWTFTKTIGCTITETIPCDDAEKICSIYDSGITFWQLEAAADGYFTDDSHVADYTYYVNLRPNQPNPVLS